MADRIERHTSTASRRSAASHRTPGRRASTDSNVDIFGDEFATEPVGVADGFRPAQATTPSHSPSPSRDHPAPARPRTPPRMSVNQRRSMMAQTSQDTKSDAAKKRVPSQANASTTMGARNSFSLRYDAADSPQRAPSMAQTEFSQRPLSSISGFSIPRTQSPFVGASGPSHPYGMYPQDTSLNRQSTTSSLGPRPERQYSGPSRPAHPYGMYPQVAAPEPEANPLAASTDIASVGFPGLGRQYARRLGPDGEEADDIIGPDGHTEQLPPYTRYPHALPSKERYAPGAPDEEASQGSPRILDADSLASDSLLTATTRVDDDAEEPASNQDPASERPTTKEVWTEKAKHRTCFGRLPYWTVVLILFAIMIGAATIGGLIGRFIRPHPKHMDPPVAAQSGGSDTDSSTVYVSMTTTIVDAAPILSVPTGLPALPTGSFGIRINPPSMAASSCLSTEPEQVIAWGCLEGGYMSFNVTPSDIDTTQVSLSSALPSYDGPTQYGPQPPALQGTVGVNLMTDKDEPELGPAYFFYQEYNKTVVLPENALNGTKRKRSLKGMAAQVAAGSESARRDLSGTVKAGDQPWFCYWNNTILEGFIYITQPCSDSATNVSTTIEATGASTAGSLQVTSAATATSTPAARLRERHHGQYNEGSTDEKSEKMPAKLPDPYPYSIKLEERRSPNNKVPAVCIQKVVAADLSIGPLLDSSGDPVTITLIEIEPVSQQRVVYLGKNKGTVWDRRDLEELGQRDDTGSCRCEWTS